MSLRVMVGVGVRCARYTAKDTATGIGAYPPVMYRRANGQGAGWLVWRGQSACHGRHRWGRRGISRSVMLGHGGPMPTFGIGPREIERGGRAVMERRDHGRTIIVALLLTAIMVIGGAIVYTGRQVVQKMEAAADNLPSLPSLPPLVLPTAAPTPTPVIVTSGTVIRQMQAVQRLETTRYTIETVVEATSGTDGVFTRGEKLLLIAHGTVVVGFDLAKLTTSDVTVSPDGKTVNVTLPPAEIFSSGLDEGKTRVYSRNSGTIVLFPKGADPNLETAARRQGLEQIMQSACEDGITRRATQDGTEALRDLLTIAGFTSVQVRVKEPATPLCASGVGTPRP